MTIKELIEQLGKLPQEMEIVAAQYDGFHVLQTTLDHRSIVVLNGEKAIIDPMDYMNVYELIDEFLNHE